MNKIELTNEDALLFIEFQKRYVFIKLMDSLGVFSIRSGSIEVHFDVMGGIGSVDIHRHFKP